MSQKYEKLKTLLQELFLDKDLLPQVISSTSTAATT